MPEDIASGSNTLFNTKIPSLTDTANIQTALRLYHYGDGVDTTKSIANHLSVLQNAIANIPVPVPLSLWSARGALVSSTAAETLTTIPLGSPGQVLTAIAGSTGAGMTWANPEVTLINSVILSNKTLTNALVSSAGIRFSGPVGNSFTNTLGINTPTANRSITLPDADTELVGINTTQTLTNKTIDLETASNTITGTLNIANGGINASTVADARTNLQIFNAQTVADGNDNRTPYSGKIYVANPSVVGAAGANIDGAAAGDLWFW
jgi:hypothetical protein